ncbi:ABC transporter ATP-binding protein [Pseudorhodoplanes sinuspersici]|uniref:Nitrate/sulfonate/bicarbonate ABC transporter ATP-binding protein n=1 Tax=Pseudorhodoplanes sinuspersici TaxID=1235591 RepID=A0A1W7A0Z7_9HYPH|nr:ABC transporter ATP-binding protein [Pseudorhodoplanes sinuspersici]ARQ03260.1 nitrate/sulfonate/bicarbonate ABC transporter ATP-binding protein [Pseudorhodoplanes sinuspersici]RKE74491.1 NitT/TauT family transport system ATP-binding protein [Pseudorhodoplanes sinuspersici]
MRATTAVEHIPTLNLVTAGTVRARQKSGEPVVEVLSAEKVFANGTRGLDPIDLTIRDGEFVSLIGPSGCGKSTLLKLVAGLSEPTDGKLVWWRGGFDQVGQPGRQMSFVFQDPTLMPWSRVETNVRLPLDLAGKNTAEANQRVDAALNTVGLSEYRRHFPRQLSGGMRMRASIARALVTDPNLLLMDEPFGALDEFTRNKLDSDLVSLWWGKSLTVIFVTHSIYEAIFLSTRIIIMAARPGRIFGEMIISEPHPRDDSFRTSQRFAQLCRDLSNMLTEASLASTG